MPDLRDPRALVRHAVQTSDLALLALIARRLTGGVSDGPGTRALVALVRLLELGEARGDDDGDA